MLNFYSPYTNYNITIIVLTKNRKLPNHELISFFCPLVYYAVLPQPLVLQSQKMHTKINSLQHFQNNDSNNNSCRWSFS